MMTVKIEDAMNCFDDLLQRVLLNWSVKNDHIYLQ